MQLDKKIRAQNPCNLPSASKYSDSVSEAVSESWERQAAPSYLAIASRRGDLVNEAAGASPVPGGDVPTSWGDDGVGYRHVTRGLGGLYRLCFNSQFSVIHHAEITKLTNLPISWLPGLRLVKNFLMWQGMGLKDISKISDTINKITHSSSFAKLNNH